MSLHTGSILGALLAGAGAVVACSGSSTSSSGSYGGCTSKGSCSNDPAPTQSEVAQCEGLASDASCGVLFQTYFACAAAHEVCTSAGTIDDAATQAAIQSGCASQISAYRACTPAGPSCGLTGQACCAGAAGASDP